MKLFQVSPCFYQRLYFRYTDCNLNSKFQASIHLLLLHMPVCVRPGRKPRTPFLASRLILYQPAVPRWWPICSVKSLAGPMKKSSYISWYVVPFAARKSTRSWYRRPSDVSECISSNPKKAHIRSEDFLCY